eukprot:m.1617928 g.1617928  ORF g.1617928 m.1617928 type:complete len:74 (+) comp25375_c0_seq4:154-375(+)
MEWSSLLEYLVSLVIAVVWWTIMSTAAARTRWSAGKPVHAALSAPGACAGLLAAAARAVNGATCNPAYCYCCC